MDELLVETLFSVTKTMILTQNTNIQADILRNLLQTWSQLFSKRNNTFSHYSLPSKRHFELIENMLYDLLRKNPNNIEFQNIAIEAVLNWIFKYLPQINKQQPSITKLLNLSKILLQISPFPIHKEYISLIMNISSISSRANSINSHEFAYQILQEIIDKYNKHKTMNIHHIRRVLKPYSLKNIKFILTHTTSGRIQDPNHKYLLQILQILQIYCDNSTQNQRSQSDIDQIINICYSVAIKHSASSDIGKLLSCIANYGSFSGLYHKLPKKYRQNSKQNLPKTSQIQSVQQHQDLKSKEMYQNQLSSLLQPSPQYQPRSISHPMRGGYDLSDQFNDISLDIRRSRKQLMGNKKCHSVPAYVQQLQNRPSIDDFKQDLFGSDDNNSQNSDKENGHNKNKNMSMNSNQNLKGAGSKRKLSSMFMNDEDSKKTQRRSSAKKLKFK